MRPAVARVVLGGGSISRGAFLAGMSALLSANQRVLYAPNGTDTTTSVESSTVGRTITWDASIATRVSKLGNGYAQSFNGTDQWGEAPDADDLSFGNGSADSAFSVLVLANPASLAGEGVLLAKWGGSFTQEWRLVLDATGLLRFFIQDASAAVAAEARSAAGGAVVGAWRLFAVSYDGTGGASAANGASVYVNGADATASRTNNASYVALENTASPLHIAARNAHTGAFLSGSVGLVALTQKALTAAEHAQAWTLCRRHFRLTL